MLDWVHVLRSSPISYYIETVKTELVQIRKDRQIDHFTLELAGLLKYLYDMLDWFLSILKK